MGEAKVSSAPVPQGTASPVKMRGHVFENKVRVAHPGGSKLQRECGLLSPWPPPLGSGRSRVGKQRCCNTSLQKFSSLFFINHYPGCSKFLIRVSRSKRKLMLSVWASYMVA